MEIINCIQGTDEWHSIRAGMVTASNYSKVINKKTGRGLYLRKCASGRMLGIPEESYKNAIMERGNETERQAKEEYEARNFCKIQQVGFVKRDEYVGASPDGLIGDDGVLEIKCPLASTHISTILKNKIDTVYIPQVQFLLWVTERKYCDYVSYAPLLVNRPYFCIRVPRDETYIEAVAKNVDNFVQELKEMIDKVNDFSGTF